MIPADLQRMHQRGRWMVLVLAAMTVGGYVHASVMDYLLGRLSTQYSELIGGWLLLGFFCWSLLRGGTIGRAVFILVYSLFLLLVLLAVVCTITVLVSYKGGDFTSDDVWLCSFHGLDRMTYGMALGLWSAWSLWVLILSKDAGVYLKARRRGRIIQEADAFEWPPVHRRPQ